MLRYLAVLLPLIVVTATGQKAAPEDRMPAVSVLLRLGEKERAARILRDLRRDLAGAKRDREAARLRRRVTELLRKADPTALRWEKAKRDDADVMVKLMRAYLRRGWLDTAREVFKSAKVRERGMFTTFLEQSTLMKNGRWKASRVSPTQAAIDRGLDWLLRYQLEDGHWIATTGSDKLGYPLYDLGVTGLALRCLQKEKYATYRTTYDEAIEKAIDHVLKQQDPMGCFGPKAGHYIYNHCICTIAVCEAFGHTGEERIEKAAREAVKFLLDAQNVGPRGEGKLAWRYGIRPEGNDTSVTGWAIAALTAALAAGIEVPEEALAGARTWVDLMYDPATGRTGYYRSGSPPTRTEDNLKKFPPEKSESITAVGLGIRACLGEDLARSKAAKMGLALCLERLPDWSPKDGSIDFYYWYFGTRASLLAGDRAWKKWRPALEKALLPHQLTEGKHRGTWPPAGPWCNDGGRVYVTAILTMALQMARARP